LIHFLCLPISTSTIVQLYQFSQIKEQFSDGIISVGSTESFIQILGFVVVFFWTSLEKVSFEQEEDVGLKMYTLSNSLKLMQQFGSLKSHQQEEGNWNTAFKDSAIYSRCVKCRIFSLLFPVSLVRSSWLCGLETPGQLCFVS